MLQLYREHFGTQPIVLDPSDIEAPLDIAAALTEDGKTLTVAIVNPSSESVNVPLSMDPAIFAGKSTRYVIAGEDRHQHNTPGEPRKIDIVETSGIDATLPLEIPAFGLALYCIPLK